MNDRPSRSRRGENSIFTTAQGTRREAFGRADWALLAASAGVWGSSFLFIAIGLDSFSPGLITFLRIIFGALAVIWVPVATRTRVSRRDWARIWVIGFTWMALPFTLFPIAQQWITSSLAGMINGAVPLITALIAAVLLRKAPGARVVVGLVIGFAGVVLIGSPALSDVGTNALGVGLVLIAVTSYGIALNLAVPLQQRYGALPVLLRVQATGIVLTLPLGIVGIRSSEFSWSSLAAVAALGVFGTGLAFVAMSTLVGRVGATRGAIAVYFIPVVAILLGVIFRDDVVPAISLVGTLLVIVGAWLASRHEELPVEEEP